MTSKSYRIAGYVALVIATVLILFGVATIMFDLGNPDARGVPAIFSVPFIIAGSILHVSASDAEKEDR